MFSASKISKPSGGGYTIARSVRLRSSATAYLNRTPASAGNRQKFTISCWVKRGKLGSTTPLFSAGTSTTTEDRFMFAGGDTFLFDGYSASSTVFNLNTTAVYRDPSAWYHFVASVDTTQATASNRILLYVNGVQITSFGTATYPAQNTSLNINNNIAHYIGTTPDPYYADDYVTEFNFIDGQALTPSSFGSINTTTGVWQPIKYTGTYGTNGFYLNFGNNASTTTLGYDTSGNSNNWTTNNISVTAGATYDSMLDVPTLYADGGNGRGNYATLNPINSLATLTSANLNYLSSASAPAPAYSTIGMISGKWYFEYTLTATNCFVGVWGNGNAGMPTGAYPIYYWDIGASSAIALNLEKTSGSASGTLGNLAASDVYGVALDIDNTTIYFYKNNSLVQTVTGMTFTGALFFVCGSFSGGTSASGNANFGQRPFTYTPPTGFVALNTQNLPTPTISNGANYMAASTYTGTGSTLTISNSTNNPAGISFQPDLVWIKSRSAANSHNLADSIRGATAGLASNSTSAEYTQNGFSAFNTNGFALTTDTSQQVNNSGSAYVGWQWKASGSTVSNTSGSITSTVSVNATAGFSVVTYTGTFANATVGHGLGVAPSMIIVKGRGNVADWVVGHNSLTSWNYVLNLDNTIAQTAYTGFNNTAPTSTVFSLGAQQATNASSIGFVAYCFASVAGYSAFGSYTGNGSTDGTFVYLGFRPRFLMIKRTDSTGSWFIIDSSRNPSNVNVYDLLADSSGAENSNSLTDFASNGFKLRSTGLQVNASGGTYIYACFAENPFRNALAR